MGKSLESERKKPGPQKVWDARITLPLTAEILAMIDALLEKDEVRLYFIRTAIEEKIARRKRQRTRMTGKDPR